MGQIHKNAAFAGELSSPGSNTPTATYEEVLHRRRAVWIENKHYVVLLRKVLSHQRMLATRMVSLEVSGLWKFPQEA